jgi:plastocyanin
MKWIPAIFAALTLVCQTVYASGQCPDCGSVSGTINVWKTKAKTKGPKGDKEVIVFLVDKSGKTYPLPEKIPFMDQKSLIFLPHVLAIQKGMTVRFLNNDSVDHNVYFLFEKTGETLDLGTYPQGIHVDHTFEKPGNVIVLCKLHLEMAAYIKVLDNPFFNLAVIDGDSQKGSYKIENVPPGDYVLKTWHKKLRMKGKQARITVESEKTTDFDITITKKKYVK